mgnify:CR=1 FL=1
MFVQNMLMSNIKNIECRKGAVEDSDDEDLYHDDDEEEHTPGGKHAAMNNKYKHGAPGSIPVDK